MVGVVSLEEKILPGGSLAGAFCTFLCVGCVLFLFFEWCLSSVVTWMLASEKLWRKVVCSEVVGPTFC
jgi:hypothetical protein